MHIGNRTMRLRQVMIGGLVCFGLVGCVPAAPIFLSNSAPDAPVKRLAQARAESSAVVPNAKPLSAINLGVSPEADRDRAADTAAVSADTPSGNAVTAPATASAVQVDATDGVTLEGGTALSDENDFDAVSERQTIESDAARLARISEAYQIIAPEALPLRAEQLGVNIVEYALQSDNLLGSPVYSRFPVGGQARFLRNCGKYPSSDMAQIEFIKRGGPKRDMLGIDPDGDGFACYWDPAPFRKAVGQ
jgi:hypothetical protein